MASITIRRLENSVKMKLRIRAAANGRSMEEEVRQILRTTIDRVPTHSIQNMDNAYSNLPLQERLIELENQRMWVTAKDPDTHMTLGKPAFGALERFVANR